MIVSSLSFIHFAMAISHRSFDAPLPETAESAQPVSQFVSALSQRKSAALARERHDETGTKQGAMTPAHSVLQAALSKTFNVGGMLSEGIARSLLAVFHLLSRLFSPRMETQQTMHVASLPDPVLFAPDPALEFPIEMEVNPLAETQREIGAGDTRAKPFEPVARPGLDSALPPSEQVEKQPSEEVANAWVEKISHRVSTIEDLLKPDNAPLLMESYITARLELEVRALQSDWKELNGAQEAVRSAWNNAPQADVERLQCLLFEQSDRYQRDAKATARTFVKAQEMGFGLAAMDLHARSWIEREIRLSAPLETEDPSRPCYVTDPLDEDADPWEKSGSQEAPR